MERRIEDVQYCERLFQSFYDIGSTSQGGVTRLGYSETEDAMHEVFKGLGRELGGSIHTDEVGNTYVANTDEMGYTLIGSHLDSVIDGGRYDQLSSRFGVDRPACGFGMNINLLYEYMNDAGLLEDTEPSFQMAVSYTAGDQTLVRDLMNWRSRGFRVAAYPDSSFIDSGDYSIHAIYRNGSYYKDGKAMTAEELEALMGRL